MCCVFHAIKKNTFLLLIHFQGFIVLLIFKIASNILITLPISGTLATKTSLNIYSKETFMIMPHKSDY